MLSIIVTLLIVGICLYVVDQIPMPGSIKAIIHAIALLMVCLWLLSAFGVAHLPHC